MKLRLWTSLVHWVCEVSDLRKASLVHHYVESVPIIEAVTYTHENSTVIGMVAVLEASLSLACWFDITLMIECFARDLMKFWKSMLRLLMKHKIVVDAWEAAEEASPNLAPCRSFHPKFHHQPIIFHFTISNINNQPWFWEGKIKWQLKTNRLM